MKDKNVLEMNEPKIVLKKIVPLKEEIEVKIVEELKKEQGKVPISKLTDKFGEDVFSTIENLIVQDVVEVV